jgi:hypothetical protein
MTGKLTLSAVAGAAVLAVAALIGFAGGQHVQAGVTEVTLDPPTATNLVGTDHTVTATVTNWPTGEIVDFQVTSGPNTGATFTCSPNVDCSTDGSGVISATYTSDGTAGTDTIQACTTPLQQLPNAFGEFQPICGTASKEWAEPSPTPTVSEPTPTPTPTEVAEEDVTGLPATGSGPADGGGFPWVVAALTAFAGLSVLSGGLLLRKRTR